MKSQLAWFALLGSTLVVAAGTATVAAPVPERPPAADGGSLIEVEVRSTVWLDHPGATAAFVVDAEIAGVQLQAGRIGVSGRSPGATVLTVVSPTATAVSKVQVVAPLRLDRIELAVARSEPVTHWAVGYDSATGRLASSLDVASPGGGERATRFNLFYLHDDDAGAGEARDILAGLRWQRTAPGSELTLFDAEVAVSPLTVEQQTLRGLHYRAGGLEVHAGATARVELGGFLLDHDVSWAVGAGYRLEQGRASLTPSLYWFPREVGGGERGAVGSLLYGWDDESLRVRAELGWGGRLGASFALDRQGDQRHTWVDARYRPAGFAAVGYATPPGSSLELGHLAGFAGGGSIGASLTAHRYELAGGVQEAAATSLQFHLPLVGGWAVLGSGSFGQFAWQRDTVTTVGLPLGLAWDGRRLGFTGQVRYQYDTLGNRVGFGGRASLRFGGERLRASGYVDYQQQVPSIELVLREVPQLARALTELGLTADSANDLARLLREDARLQQLGLVESSSLRLDPGRLQVAGSLTWSATARGNLHLHLLYDRRRAVTGDLATALATLSWSQRLTAGAEVVAGVTRWQSDLPAAAALSDTTYQLGVRGRLRGTPTGWRPGGGVVTGTVFRDDAARGAFAEHLPGVAGVEVRLDDGRSVRTDAQGAFRFAGVGGGDHRVEVIAPGGTFFTTASSHQVTGGKPVRIGLAWAPAWLEGAVRDREGNPVAGVAVALVGTPGPTVGAPGGPTYQGTAATDSSGRYRIAIAAGTWTISVREDTVPPGYSVAGLAEQRITLAQGAPSRVDFEVPALRSISGQVDGPVPAGLAVRLLEVGRGTPVGSDGRFVFRDVAPGIHTVAVQVDGVVATHQVTVPVVPSTVGGIHLAPRPASGQAMGRARR